MARRLVPTILAVAVMMVGIINIASVLGGIKWLRWFPVWERYLPMVVSDLSRHLLVISGFFLLYLSDGLARRKRLAWILTVVIIGLSLAVHIMHGFRWVEVTVSLVLLLTLFVFRKIFTVKSNREKPVIAVWRSFLILSVLLIYSTAGFYAFKREFNQRVNWNAIYKDYAYTIWGVGRDTLVPRTKRARWFEESISIVGVTVMLLLVRTIFSPWIDNEKSEVSDLDEARDLILLYGGNPLDYFSLMPDKKLWFRQGCVIGYGIFGDIAVVLGEPIGKTANKEAAGREFVKEMEERGLKTIFHQTSDVWSETCKKWGMESQKIGEEEIIGLEKFDLNLSELADVRHATTKIARESVNFSWYPASEIPEKQQQQLRELYSGVLASGQQRKMGFFANFYPLPKDQEVEVLFMSDINKKIVGFLSFLPSGREKMVLDLMLRDKNAPNGIIEAGMANAVEHFRAGGKSKLSLGLTPFAGNTIVPAVLDKFKRIYRYKSLVKFKSKFNPIGEARYLVYPGVADVPKILVALLKLHFM